MDVYQTYCDHFAIYINIKSLCCIAENKIIICQLHHNKLKNKKTGAYTIYGDVD